METKRILVLGVFALLVIVLLMMVSKTRTPVGNIVSKVPVIGSAFSKVPVAF